jgi:hypothetical protein
MNVLWNIYALSSANLTLFRSVTRARIYLTNNITLALQLAFQCTLKQPEISLCRHYCSCVSGGEVMWSQETRVRRSTLPCRHALHWSDPRGHIRQTIYAPLPTCFTNISVHKEYRIAFNVAGLWPVTLTLRLRPTQHPPHSQTIRGRNWSSFNDF